jgi:hypothetical protein
MKVPRLVYGQLGRRSTIAPRLGRGRSPSRLGQRPVSRLGRHPASPLAGPQAGAPPASRLSRYPAPPRQPGWARVSAPAGPAPSSSRLGHPPGRPRPACLASDAKRPRPGLQRHHQAPQAGTPALSPKRPQAGAGQAPWRRDRSRRDRP